MKKQIKTQYGIVSYPSEVSGREVVTSIWEKNGHSRVYFKILFPGSTPVDCGYFDAKAGRKVISSRPVSWGQNLETCVSFEPANNADKQETYNTGFGYYGTAADAKRGVDGIE